MKALLAGIIVGASCVGIVAQAQKTDPFTGTWKLSIAKSKMVSPSTASKTETVTYKYVNGEEIYASDVITAQDEKEHTDYRGRNDEYTGPLGHIKTTIGSKTTEGPLQLRRLDARTRLRMSMNPDGTMRSFIVRRLSEDGKTITSSILRFEKDGAVTTGETRVFEKQ